MPKVPDPRRRHVEGRVPRVLVEQLGAVDARGGHSRYPPVTGLGQPQIQGGRGDAGQYLVVNPAIRLISVPGLAPVDYAHIAAVDEPVTSLWLAGACPLDSEGRTVAPGDVATQAEVVMANLSDALAEVGADLTDLVKTTVFVASAASADLVTAWDIYRRHMSGHDVPSTLLGVAALGYPDQLVEVEAVAVLPLLGTTEGA
jgi:enamine deaminase RidA (YjgF/YER057c/UK114 family)